MSSKSILRDPLLLVASLLAILSGWSCFSILGGPSPTYSVRDNRANDKAGVTIPSQGGSATLDIHARTTWKEFDCSYRRRVLNPGRTTSATINDEGVLTVTGSVQDAGTHLTTVTVETVTENCNDARVNGIKDVTRVAVNFE